MRTSRTAHSASVSSLETLPRGKPQEAAEWNPRTSSTCGAGVVATLLHGLVLNVCQVAASDENASSSSVGGHSVAWFMAGLGATGGTK